MDENERQKTKKTKKAKKKKKGKERTRLFSSSHYFAPLAVASANAFFAAILQIGR